MIGCREPFIESPFKPTFEASAASAATVIAFVNYTSASITTFIMGSSMDPCSFTPFITLNWLDYKPMHSETAGMT